MGSQVGDISSHFHFGSRMLIFSMRNVGPCKEIGLHRRQESSHEKRSELHKMNMKSNEEHHMMTLK